MAFKAETHITLTDEEHAKLRKFAGMLGSQYDGERLNALGFIQRMADAKKVRVDELLLARMVTVVRQAPQEPPRREPPRQEPPRQEKPKTDYRAKMKACVEHHDEEQAFMTAWERSFAEDMAKSTWAAPTEKQQIYVDRILAKFAKIGGEF